MARPKVRSHNEWFRPVSCGNRKSCPRCSAKLLGESIWSWGEYAIGKWRTVKHFCQRCFAEAVLKPLLGHAGDCGCTIELVGYHCSLPAWLSLGAAHCPVPAPVTRTPVSSAVAEALEIARYVGQLAGKP